MYADPKLNHFLEIVRYTAFALCIIVNGVLLKMIFMKRNNDLGTYRFMLLAFVLADTFYGFAHFLICPVPEFYKTAFLMGGHGTWTSRYGIGFMWPLAFSVPFPMLSFNFAYRLVAVKHPFNLDWFTSSRVIILMVAIGMANCAAWGGLSLFMGFDSEESKRYVHSFFTANDTVSTYLKHDWAHVDDYIVVVFWDHGFFNGSNSKSIIGSLILGAFGIVAYKFMVYAAIEIVHNLKQVVHMSERSHKQHVQLLRALVLQAITPFITSFIPMGTCGFLPFFGADLPIFSVVCPPFCALHPVLDGAIMIATVSQFRNTFVDWIRCRKPRRNSRVILIDHEDKHESGGRKNTY